MSLALVAGKITGLISIPIVWQAIRVDLLA
jgi:hypothetical protein